MAALAAARPSPSAARGGAPRRGPAPTTAPTAARRAACGGALNYSRACGDSQPPPGSPQGSPPVYGRCCALLVPDPNDPGIGGGPMAGPNPDTHDPVAARPSTTQPPLALPCPSGAAAHPRRRRGRARSPTRHPPQPGAFQSGFASSPRPLVPCLFRGPREPRLAGPPRHRARRACSRCTRPRPPRFCPARVGVTVARPPLNCTALAPGQPKPLARAPPLHGGHPSSTRSWPAVYVINISSCTHAIPVLFSVGSGHCFFHPVEGRGLSAAAAPFPPCRARASRLPWPPTGQVPGSALPFPYRRTIA
jgi:hypothetical protein